MKKLDKEALMNRRVFLAKAQKIALKRVLPAIVVYSIAKSTPPLFGQSTVPPRQEPI